jgi:hypothetical protein
MRITTKLKYKPLEAEEDHEWTLGFVELLIKMSAHLIARA